MLSKALFTLLTFYLASVCATYFALFFFRIFDMSNSNVNTTCVHTVGAWRDCVLLRRVLCGNFEQHSETDNYKQKVLYA